MDDRESSCPASIRPRVGKIGKHEEGRLINWTLSMVRIGWSFIDYKAKENVGRSRGCRNKGLIAGVP